MCIYAYICICMCVMMYMYVCIRESLLFMIFIQTPTLNIKCKMKFCVWPILSFTTSLSGIMYMGKSFLF